MSCNKVIPLTANWGGRTASQRSFSEEERQTGRKEEEGAERLSMADKSGMRQVKGQR